ncbi:AMP-binding protein [Streptomyces sp. NPDC049687]|uniref:AMP-binding protein n=1 Tax=Streptomyces sp. NPDC049687 TaxID=3365596 RepID=UPI0037B0F6A5
MSAVGSIANALAAWGMKPGDVAALVAPNSADYPAVFHGVLRSGGVLTPANPRRPTTTCCPRRPPPELLASSRTTWPSCPTRQGPRGCPRA